MNATAPVVPGGYPVLPKFTSILELIAHPCAWVDNLTYHRLRWCRGGLGGLTSQLLILLLKVQGFSLPLLQSH